MPERRRDFRRQPRVGVDRLFGGGAEAGRLTANAENAPSSSEARTNRILTACVDQVFAPLDWRPAFRGAPFDRICPSPNFFAKADLCAA